jgi:hypothetical protein
MACSGILQLAMFDSRVDLRMNVKITTVLRQSYGSFSAGWWFGICLFSIIYGMSSFPLTFIFVRGVQTTNQSGMEHRKDHLNAHLEIL